ncbi:hypothetical protein Ahy_B07g086909 [Arachis hypogaea]|uniref:Uncharacterized protein n=1 Tax=Arachis hypogaea TaxID=3818 RepID=A0A444YAU6_ARAHY|nr:hypothetical protein Ahy_B07g086909 [Arachis hypogaea]
MEAESQGLRVWVVPSFGNHEVPNSMEIILLDEHNHILEGQVYRMTYFIVVSNHGSYRATHHEFKLVFFTEPLLFLLMMLFQRLLLNMTQDYDYLVGMNIVVLFFYSSLFKRVMKIFNKLCFFETNIIGFLTSVGEEKEYTKEENIVKMIVLELSSKDLTMCCALFGEYVNQVNHFLASAYVEQPVVVIQLAKVKFFRGQIGLQNVMYVTQILFNYDLPEVVDFSMIEQGINGAQPLFITNEGKVVSLEDDFMRLTRRCTIEELQDNNELAMFIFKIKITLEDHSGEGIFVLFDREASYLVKKSYADLFTEVQKDAIYVIVQFFIAIFFILVEMCYLNCVFFFSYLENSLYVLLLKIDNKGVEFDKFFGTFRVRRVCDDPTIIVMLELPDYDADNESTPKKEPALQKSMIYGRGDIDVKKESSSTSIKSNKVTGESSGILCKSPILITNVSGGNEVAAVVNDENEKPEKIPTLKKSACKKLVKKPAEVAINQ